VRFRAPLTLSQKRVKVAIKYILGYKCKYGNWEEFIWNVDDAPKLEEMAKIIKKIKCKLV
jgi:hypothetical protein